MTERLNKMTFEQLSHEATRVKAGLVKRLCMGCDEPNMAFENELEVKEYQISRLCKRCQDEVFNSKYCDHCGISEHEAEVKEYFEDQDAMGQPYILDKTLCINCYKEHVGSQMERHAPEPSCPKCGGAHTPYC